MIIIPIRYGTVLNIGVCDFSTIETCSEV